MRVIVKSDHHRTVRLRFPTGLALNGFTACFVPMALKGGEVKITRRQAVKLFREIKRCKKRFPDWKIVEVKSSDGEFVEVKL